MPVASDQVFPGGVLAAGPIPEQPRQAIPPVNAFNERVSDVADANAEAVRDLLRAYDVTPEKLRDQTPGVPAVPGLDELRAAVQASDNQTPADEQPAAAHFDRKGTGWFDP